jgi:hypothetical protein
MGENLPQDRKTGVDLLRPDDERRREAQNVRARRRDEKPCGQASVDDRPRGDLELGADQQTSSADLADEREAAQGVLEGRARLLDVGQQLVADLLADRAGGRADDRVSAEGRCVVSRLERTGGLVRDEEAADREAVGEPLRQSDEIGTYTQLLEGEERPRAAGARLHLVEAEERTELGGHRGRRGGELGRRRPDSPLALDRLEQDQPRLGARSGLERRDVVQPRELDA